MLLLNLRDYSTDDVTYAPDNNGMGMDSTSTDVDIVTFYIRLSSRPLSQLAHIQTQKSTDT